MSQHRPGWAWALVAGAAVAAGCAAPSQSAPPPSTAEPAGGEGAPAAQVRRRAEAEDDEDKAGPAAAIAHAKRELDIAQRELLASASDCAAACRALASMERAAGHLCGLAREDEDRQRCEEAKRDVLQARERVRSTCAECAGGPSLDKNAPLLGGP